MHSVDALPRPSTASSAFSEYDDLRDFDGRFDSRSTLGPQGDRSAKRASSEDQAMPKRKNSRGFLGRLKGAQTTPQTPPCDKSPSGGPGRTLKALRSMGSLKGKSSSGSSHRKMSTPPSAMPHSLKLDVGLGFDAIDWSPTAHSSANSSASGTPDGQERFKLDEHLQSNGHNRRAGGRRSVSFGATGRSAPASVAGSVELVKNG